MKRLPFLYLYYWEVGYTPSDPTITFAHSIDAVFAALRIYALCDRNRYILFIILGLNLVPAGVNTVRLPSFIYPLQAP